MQVYLEHRLLDRITNLAWKTSRVMSRHQQAGGRLQTGLAEVQRMDGLKVRLLAHSGPNHQCAE